MLFRRRSASFPEIYPANPRKTLALNHSRFANRLPLLLAFIRHYFDDFQAHIARVGQRTSLPFFYVQMLPSRAAKLYAVKGDVSPTGQQDPMPGVLRIHRKCYTRMRLHDNMPCIGWRTVAWGLQSASTCRRCGVKLGKV
jgi:hypothetical protein